MDANFTEEQHALAQVAGEVFAAANPPARVRQLGERAEPRDRKVWRQLADVGLTGIGVPEEHGGLGGDAADLALVLEQAGRHLLPEPLTATIAVAVPVLVAAGGDAADHWLPRIAAGDATATLAIAPLAGDEVPYVLDVDDADIVLVERENTLWLDRPVDDAERVRSEDGTRRRFRRPALRGELLGGREVLEEARMRMLAARAAELVGVADALVDQCVGYAGIRRQFDTPIGAFQAIQHVLANAFVSVESARGAVRHAIRRIALGGDDRHHATHVAAAAAAATHRRVNTDALQVHAGIGFTWEHDLQLWLKRGLSLEAELGPVRRHREALAAKLFDD